MTADTPSAAAPLAPCPFCGATEADIDRPVIFDLADLPDGTVLDGKPRYEPFCYNCDATLRRYGTKAEAIAAWNRRPATPAPEPSGLAWRTIDSAPKDGTWIWAYWPVQCFEDRQRVTMWDSSLPDRHCWIDSADTDSGVQPTHWQPLPEQPRAEGGGS